jgi:hypothetical protein
MSDLVIVDRAAPEGFTTLSDFPSAHTKVSRAGLLIKHFASHVAFVIGSPIIPARSPLLRMLFQAGDDDLGREAMEWDGHFLIVGVDSAGNMVAITDASGGVPLYLGPDAAATNANLATSSGRADTVSVYDFTLHRSCCHPYTWFDDVRVANPASIIRRTGRATHQHHYWCPADEEYVDLESGAEELRDRMRKSVGRANDRRGALMMSAGEDSRVIAAMCKPERTTCYIFCDAINREVAIAELVTRAMGLKLVPLIRERRDALTKLDERQAMVGFGYDVTQGHVFPFLDKIPEQRLIGGWTSDTMFKGYFMKPAKRGVFVDYGLRGDFDCPREEELRARYQARHDELTKLVPSPPYEWMRKWPLSAHPHFGHYAAARRHFDLREPYFHAQTYRFAAKLRPEDRFSRKLFYEAFREPMGLAGWLPTARGTIPALNGAETEWSMQLVKYHDEHINPGVAQGSWGRATQMKRLPEYPAFAGRFDTALDAIDDGVYRRWLAARSQADKGISENRTIQVAAALSKRN